MPTTKARAKTKAKPVDFVNNAVDLRCAMLGSLGFSTAAIMGRCNLTTSQVGYRLRKAGVKRMDYRCGDSKTAAYVIQAASARVSQEIRDWATHASGNGKARR